MADLIDSARITLTCAECRTSTPADPRHLPNLTAAGPWRCHTHQATGQRQSIDDLARSGGRT